MAKKNKKFNKVVRYVKDMSGNEHCYKDNVLADEFRCYLADEQGVLTEEWGGSYRNGWDIGYNHLVKNKYIIEWWSNTHHSKVGRTVQLLKAYKSMGNKDISPLIL